MSRTVNCQMLHKELPALEFQPYPGELGQRIFDHISAEAWQQWLAHQTMLINERQLSLIDPEARSYLEGEMDKFLFGGDYDEIAGYVPEDD